MKLLQPLVVFSNITCTFSTQKFLNEMLFGIVAPCKEAASNPSLNRVKVGEKNQNYKIVLFSILNRYVNMCGV